MAEELVGFKIVINGQEKVVKSLGEMKQLLKEANFELLSAQKNFGEYSDQAIQAAKKVATLKDSIQEAGETAQLFDPGKKFQAFSGAISAVAGGFAALQGAIGLVGEESQDLQKTLVKVQSALALSQGLSTITDSAKDFQRLKVVAVDAFKSIRAAIGSLGIGALVIAVGAIVAYWDEIKAAVSGVSKEQRNVLKTSEANAKAEQEKLDALNSQDNVLKLQGKSEKDILNLKIKQTDEVIKATEENINQQKIVTQAQVAASKRNKEILQGIIQFIAAPITALLVGIDSIGKAFGKNFNLREKFSGGLAGLVFDPVQVEQEGKDALKALNTQLANLKNQRAGFQLAIKDINKKEATDAQKDNEERAKKELEARQILEEAKASLLSERRQKEFAINKEYDDKEKALKEAGVKDDGSLAKARQNALKELDDTYKKESKDREKEFLDSINELRTKTRIEGIKDENEKAIETIKAEYEKQRQEILRNEKITIFQKIALLSELQKQQTLALEKQSKVAAEKKLNDDLSGIKISADKTINQRKSQIDQEKALIQNAYKNNIIDKVKYNEKIKELADREVAIEQEKYDSIINSITKVKDTFTSIAVETGKNLDYQQQLLKQNLDKGLITQEQYNRQSEELSKKKAIQERNLALFSLAIDTGVAIAGIVRQVSKNPLNLTGFAFAADLIARTGLVLTNMLKARNAINQAKLTSASNVSGLGGSGGGEAPMSPASSPEATSTLLNAQAIQRAGSATNRAYVLETDITNSQERIRRINRAARLG